MGPTILPGHGRESQEWITEQQGFMPDEAPIFVVANREILRVTADLKVKQSSGGLATGLKDLLRKPDNVTICSWEVDSNNNLSIRSINNLKEAGILENFPYNLLGIPINEKEKRGYYSKTANSDLWPLLHGLPERREAADLASWGEYRAVNQKFADAIVHHAGTGDYIWIHDYHLLFAPAMVREKMPDANLGFFLHAPWPQAKFFQRATEPAIRREILEGILGNDLIGFQTKKDALQFLHSLDENGYEVDFCSGAVKSGDNRTVHVGNFPISIDYHAIRDLASSPEVRRAEQEIREQYPGETVFFGVERLDFTKGIAERFQAIEKLLESHPELRGRIRLRQHVDVGRQSIPEYRRYKEELRGLADQINQAFQQRDDNGEVTWRPIDYFERTLSREEIVGYGRGGQVWMVTPLRDGMNLVAKELSAAKDPIDEHDFAKLSTTPSLRERLGIGILSTGAGAAEQLGEYVITVEATNPADIARGMNEALQLLLNDPEKVASSLNALHAHLKENTIDLWSSNFLNAFHASTLRRARDPRQLPARILSLVPESGPKPVKEHSVIDELTNTVRSASSVLFAIEIDGVLTDYEKRPEDAAIARRLRDLLLQIGARADIHLVLMSGREVGQVKRILGDGEAKDLLSGKNIIINGLHGGEVYDCKQKRFLRIQDGSLKKLMATVASDLSERIRDGDVHFPERIIIESKGSILAFHYAHLEEELPGVARQLKGELVNYLYRSDFRARWTIREGWKSFELCPKSFAPAEALRFALHSLKKELTAGDQAVFCIGNPVTTSEIFDEVEQFDGIAVALHEPKENAFYLSEPAGLWELLESSLERRDTL